MEINDLPGWSEREFAFPLSRSTVIGRAGDLEIDAPDRADSETLATLLERGGEETYRSYDELLDVIRGNLSDGYIGRKFYDDRGNNPLSSGPDDQTDPVDVSF